MNRSRILIVEDERLVAEDLRDSLAHVGYDVVAIASSGERAIDLVAELLPDLVLMDINLGGEMDGIATARNVREKHSTPVIYLTAFSNDETLARARDTDAFGFIVKPFQEKAVVAAIEMALGKRSKEMAERRREEMLHSGLMSLPLGVVMTDEQARVVFANGTARMHIGRTLGGEDVVRLSDVFEEAAPEERGTDAGGIASEARGAIYEMTGRRLPVVYSDDVLRGEGGAIIGRILIYQDAKHPPFSGELGRLLRSFMQSANASPGGPAQFLTICAWSKRIKVDDQTWVSFEDFLTHYLGLHVTHGMSPDVAGKWIANNFSDPK
ncbi:MAG: response regulator [Opitutaceae bacterium]